MKTRLFLLLAAWPALALAFEPQPTSFGDTAKPETIPWDQIGATAGADYKGDGLSVTATGGGARLRCTFQRLEAEVTRDGLFLNSTTPGQSADHFQVKAVGLARQSTTPGDRKELPRTGQVSVEGQTVCYIRPGLVEEYTSSMDGVRQDFVVVEKLPSKGELEVHLTVTGATVQRTTDGAQLVLKSGRKIAFSRLRVTDATGKELPARIEVPNHSDEDIPQSPASLLVCVDDANAVYPVRIDPTFSDANWISVGSWPGTDDTVFAAVFDASGNLYIGGDFTAIGNQPVNRVAKWNGTNWTGLGTGVDSTVITLAVDGSNVYAGGTFTMAGGNPANCVARWDGSSWTALGAGISNTLGLATVYAMLATNNVVYAAGSFDTAGGSPALRIAKWDGNNWTILGSGIAGGSVYALAMYGNELYAAGGFSSAGGNSVANIAKWNGSTWNSVGTGMNGEVDTLVVAGGNLYAAGYFDSAGGYSTPSHIARWSGSTWTAVGTALDLLDKNYSPYVLSLLVQGSDVYAAGRFDKAGGIEILNIAKWNGSTWSAMGAGNLYNVRAFAKSGNDLYTFGQFTSAGRIAAAGMAKWDGTNWNALLPGVMGQILALTASGNNLYAAGSFGIGRAGAYANVAKWDGNEWKALGSGIPGTVYALAADGSNLYAGGQFGFGTSGGIYASSVAKWDGTNWSALGSGVDGDVRSLALSGGNLFAGGNFTIAGGIPASNIARWDGTNWSALGDGLGGYSDSVFALVAKSNYVYAGGEFTNAGAVSAQHVARWDGTNWSPLAAGLGEGSYEAVRAMAESGSDLYAASGGTVAKWNGNAWTNLKITFNYPVYALAAVGSNVYASGDFTSAYDQDLNYHSFQHIAMWNGTAWNSVGSGVEATDLSLWYGPPGTANALLVSSHDLYVGGRFYKAGGEDSPVIAKVIILPFPPLLESVDLSNGAFRFSFTNTPGMDFSALTSTNLSLPLSNWDALGGVIETSPGQFTFTNAPTTGDTRRFYRVSSP